MSVTNAGWRSFPEFFKILSQYSIKQRDPGKTQEKSRAQD